MFIKCDTIKIRCNKKYLKETKIKFNILHNKRDEVQGYCFNSKYHSDMPYNLYIATNNYHNTLEIEFSSKILKERYCELINKDNIRKCLENINGLGICTLDVDGILRNGWIIKADITKDIDLKLTNDILNSLNNNVGNYRRFKWEHYEGRGITFKKDVLCGKEQIRVYNKYAELLKHSRRFVDSLSNRSQIMNYFYGKTRFEVTLGSEDEIREKLGVGTSIKEFFDKIDDVVRKQFNKVFDVDAKILNTNHCKGYEEWVMAQILDKFNGNLQLIEQSLRDVYNSRNGLSERMKKYQSVKIKINKEDDEIIKQVRNLL